MKDVITTVFSSPRRLLLTALTVLALIMVAVSVVLAIRIQSLLAATDARPTSTATPVDQRTLTPVEPLTTRDQEYIDTPPADPFADLGDPRPQALSAVDAWVRMDVEAMQRAYLPAALDSVIGSPPVAGFRLEGEPVVESGGPTKAVVLMDTNARLLELVLVASEGAWMVESIGYRP